MREAEENLPIGEVRKPKLTPEGEKWFKREAPTFLQLASSFLYEVNDSLTLAMYGLSFLKAEIDSNNENLNTVFEGVTRIVKVTKRIDLVAKACRENEYAFEKISPEGLKSLFQTKLGEQITARGDLSESSGLALIDTTMMSSAFDELVRNSKESESKRISVEIASEEEKLEIKLVDDGQRVEKGEANQLSIGLFMAKTIVFAHGGGIEITPKEAEGEKGTVVKITLPLIRQ